MEQDAINGVVNTARGISEFGMLAVAASAFIVIAVIMMIFIFRWFMKMVNRIFENQQKSLDNIIQGIVNQGNKIDQIKEAFTGEIMNQIRVFMRYALEFNKHAVCTTVIGNIKEKNGIENKKATEKKVRDILNNLYKSLKTDIDAFQYDGRKLSEYFSDEWIERVYSYCIDAIYDGNEYHRERYLRELDTMFEGIKIEFFDNLKK